MRQQLMNAHERIASMIDAVESIRRCDYGLSVLICFEQAKLSLEREGIALHDDNILRQMLKEAQIAVDRKIKIEVVG
jgi:hypothetical protein